MPGVGVRQRGAVTLAIAAAAACLAVLASSADTVPLATEGRGGWYVEGRGDGGSGSEVASRPATSSEDDADDGTVSALVQLASLAVLGLAALVVIRAVARLVQLGDRNEPRPPPVTVRADGPPPALVEAVDEGLVALAGGPVDDAIVACWIGVEDAAAAAGTARSPSETSGELARRILDDASVPAEPVDRLLALYRTARYSRHRCGEADRAAAVDALAAIRASLERAPA